MQRSGDTSESGSTKGRKKGETSSREEENAYATNELLRKYGFRLGLTMEDYGLFESNEDSIRLALAPQDPQNAMDLPTAGWPSYQELYRCDPPVPALYGNSQIAGLEAVGHRATCNRQAGRDIVPRALDAAGAERVDASEWLMMNEQGDM